MLTIACHGVTMPSLVHRHHSLREDFPKPWQSTLPAFLILRQKFVRNNVPETCDPLSRSLRSLALSSIQQPRSVLLSISIHHLMERNETGPQKGAHEHCACARLLVSVVLYRCATHGCLYVQTSTRPTVSSFKHNFTHIRATRDALQAWFMVLIVRPSRNEHVDMATAVAVSAITSLRGATNMHMAAQSSSMA